MNSTHRAWAGTTAEREAARLRLVAKEQDLTRARDAFAADRRRLPWLKVEQEHVFDGPNRTVRPPDLFDGCRQLPLYRASFEPGVSGRPDHACVGCSLIHEDSPEGHPQVLRFSWLNRHDECGPTEPASQPGAADPVRGSCTV